MLKAGNGKIWQGLAGYAQAQAGGGGGKTWALLYQDRGQAIVAGLVASGVGTLAYTPQKAG